MSSELLSRSLARALYSDGRITCASFPRGVSSDLLNQLTQHANSLAREARRDQIYALRVVSGAPSEEFQVSARQVLKYRAGSRLLIWSEDDFDPDWSFGSTVETILHADFPARAHYGFTIDSIAAAIRAECEGAFSDKLAGNDWSILETCTLDVLVFLREALQESGDQELRWTSAWWAFVLKYASTLDTQLDKSKPGSVSVVRLCYASAGLPIPSGLNFEDLKPKKYAEIVNKQWATKEKSEESLRSLDALPDSLHGLGKLPWDDYSHQLLTQGHEILALTSLGDTQQRFDAWAGTREAIFLGTGDATSNEPIEFSFDGDSLPSPGDTDLFILPTERMVFTLGETSKSCRVRLGEIGIALPWKPDVTPPKLGSLDPTSIAVRIAGAREWIVEIDEASVASDSLKLIATLSATIKSNSNWPSSALKVSLSVPSSSDVFGLVDASATARIAIPHPWGPWATLVHGRGKKKIEVNGGGAVQIDGKEVTSNKEQAPSLVSLSSSRSIQSNAELVLYNCQADAERIEHDVTLYCDGEEIPSTCGSRLPMLRASGVQLTGENVLVATVSDRVYELFDLHAESNAPRPWLPVVATCLGVDPEVSQPLPEMEQSLWGRVEELLSQAVEGLLAESDRSSRPGGGLWQSVIPLGNSKRLIRTPLQTGDPVTWLADVSEQDKSLADVGRGPSRDLLNSEAAAEFWKAFRTLVEAVPNRDQLSRPWPCRWQFQSQQAPVSPLVLERLLKAYNALLDRAENNGSADKFWASYPFSVLLYDMQESKVSAIALSPLHPVRLAWLYGLERAVAHRSSADNGQELLQIAEGWNFPWLGPAPAPAGNEAWLTAIPIDAGARQLFLGWSMLAEFDNVRGSGLSVPSQAAGLSVPGGSSSGLNQGGVRAALRDLLRVYPHLATLHVDLHAAREGARSDELDRAVLEEFASATAPHKVRARLPGGLRVHDSSRRKGSPPHRYEAAEALADSESEGLPLVWCQYNPDGPDDSPQSDLRFVEDSRAHVAIVPGHKYGSTPRWPLKRFAVHEFQQSDGDICINICIDSENAAPESIPLISVLSRIEGGNKNEPRALRVRADDALRSSQDGALWVVSGSIHVNPGALTRAIAQQQSHSEHNEVRRLLWEWRPAQFQQSSAGGEAFRLEGRPYTTIASVPKAFEQSLTERLQVSPELTGLVFNELGRRGIGLASLLTVGGNQALGALGFFLGFKLLDCGEKDSGTYRLTIPIDVVDPLLRSISGCAKSDAPKRADLLLVEIKYDDRPHIKLAPIELKCYGFDDSSPAMKFPSQESGQVKSALDQLADSGKVLQAIEQVVRGARQAGSSDRTLEHSALAALLESAVLLKTDVIDPKIAADAIKGVAQGAWDVTAGRSLLIWLQDTPKDVPSVRHRLVTLPEENSAILYVDPSIGSTDWSRAPQELVDPVQRAMSWCLEGLRDDAIAASGEKTGSSNDNGVRSSQEARASGSHDSEASGVPAESRLNLEKSTSRGDSVTDIDKPGVGGEAGTSGGAQNEELPRTLPKEGERESSVWCPLTRPSVLLGASSDGHEISWDPFHPAKRLNNAHMVVLGASGAGKTQVTRAIVHEFARLGGSSLIFDFKDDYVEREFRDSIGARMLEADEGLPVNPLALVPDPISGKIKVQNKIYEVAGILRKVYRLGDQQESKLRNAIGNAYQSAGIPLRGAVPDGVEGPSFSMVAGFLEDEGDANLVNRLSPIFDLELFAGKSDSLINYLHTPTVIRLSTLPTEEAKRATAEVVLMSLYSTLLRLGHCTGTRLAIVVDEAHKIANLDAMNLLLKEGRSYGASILLSSQEARDFSDTVFSNAGSLLVLKLSETRDSERVANLLGTSGDAKTLSERIRGLPQFHGLFRNDQYHPYSAVKVVPHYERSRNK